MIIFCVWFAANFVLLPFNYLVSSGGEGPRSPLADSSLQVLLILIHYRKCILVDESIADRKSGSATSDSLSKENTYFSENPYCKALENARDIECKFLLPITFWMVITCIYGVWRNEFHGCSWSCGYWGECTQWSTREITFCFVVWHSWHVSLSFSIT